MRAPLASLLGGLGYNTIEITPTEKIGSAVVTFRLRLIAPPVGGVLVGQSKWFAQPQRRGEASDYLRRSTFGVGVAVMPSASIVRASNVAAGALNKVLIMITSGVTFFGAGSIKVTVPAAYEVAEVQVDTSGYSRLGGSGGSMGSPFISGNVVVVELLSTSSIFSSAIYGLVC